jgi:photosystem II stability/assembly factor-like uncharacterized protein
MRRSILVLLTFVSILYFSDQETANAQRKKTTSRSRAALPSTPFATIEPNGSDNQLVWVQIYGARVFNLYSDRRDPKTVYATTPLGLYKSMDGGFRWTFVFAPPFPDPQILARDGVDYYPPASSLVFSQSKSSPNVMFIAANWSGDRWPTIWKSENGGIAWTDASAGVIPTGSANPQQNITQIEIAQHDPSIVYVAFYYGPIYKTLNGGKSWGKIEGEKRISIDPTNPDHLIRLGAESTDGGITWSKRGGYPVVKATGFSFDEVAFHPTSPKLLLGRTGGDCGNCSNGYWISENSGQTWRDLGLRGSVAKVAFAASEGSVYAAANTGVFLSTNLGRSWRQIFDQAATSVLVVDASTLYATTGNGIWKSSNGGGTWHRANFMLPMPITRDSSNQTIFDRLCWVDGRTNTVYVGSRGGYWTTSDWGFNWSWNSLSGNGQILSARVAADGTKFFVVLDFGTFTWEVALIKMTSQGKVEQLSSHSVSSWMRAGWSGADSLFGVSESDASTIYDQGRVSDDSGFSWRQTSLSNFNLRQPRIIVSPASSRVAYVLDSAEGAALLVTNDGGGSWNKLSMTHVPQDLAPDPKEAATVYAIIQQKLWRSRNAGTTWEAIMDLSRILEFSGTLAINPKDSNNFYILANNGLLESKNGGKSWYLHQNGLNGDRLEKLFASGERVLAQGRFGIYLLSDDQLTWAKEKWKSGEEASAPSLAGNSSVASSESVESESAEKPLSDASILAELIELNNNLTGAGLRGDRATIEAYLTDDFVYRDVGNRKQMDRAKFLSKIKHDRSIRNYSCNDYRLARDGKQVTLTYVCEYDISSLLLSTHVRQRFTDRFVKHDGTWKSAGEDSIVVPINRP